MFSVFFVFDFFQLIILILNFKIVINLNGTELPGRQRTSSVDGSERSQGGLHYHINYYVHALISTISECSKETKI